MSRRFAIVLFPVLFFTSHAVAGQKTVWDGVYVASQAASGQAIYTEFCATCHSVNLGGGANQGAPPLKGDKFMENWREDNLESLYTKIKTTMPHRNEKSLSEKETLDLIAFILQSNEFPAGPELSVSTLNTVRIQLKDGPKPLPNYAIVEVVGCMSPDGDAWSLSNAAQPMRIRTSEKSTPEELKSAAIVPLGSMTFRLQNLAMLGAFTPEAHKGHKMMAKGPIIRQSGTDRISVTELEMLSAACDK